jgi:hypothetical protein
MRLRASSVLKRVSALTVAPNPARSGQVVRFTASVSAATPSSGAADGTVTFKEGAAILGTATLAAGKAVFTTSALSTGGHTVTANYGGSSNWAASASNTVTEVIGLKVRGPFQVNSFNGTKGDAKQAPAVATLGNGGFVVVWQSRGEDGSGYGIYGQLFKAGGTRSGHEFKINSTTANDQIEPAVAALNDGGFIVVWRSTNAVWSVSAQTISAQRYNSAGVRSGGEFRINTTIAKDETEPAVAGLADGGFVVTWAANGQDGSGYGIYAQRYTKRSAKSGGEFRINTTTAGDQRAPSVAASSDGGFVVVWASNAQQQFGYDIYGQRFIKRTVKAGGEFPVNTTRTADQTQPAIAVTGSGGFVVTWTSDSQDGSGLGVYAQHFNASATKLGSEFRVNTVTVNDQSEPAIASFVDGGFVILWTSHAGGARPGKNVYGQAYDKNGNPLNAQFLAGATTAGNQWQSRASALSPTGFVVVWTTIAPTSRLQGIDAQLLAIGGL